MTSKKKSIPQGVKTSTATKSVFDILGLSKLSADHKAQMLQKMLQIVYQRVVARIADTVPQSSLDTLTKAFESNDEKAASALLAKVGLPPFPALMAEEALALKFEMSTLSAGDSVL